MELCVETSCPQNIIQNVSHLEMVDVIGPGNDVVGLTRHCCFINLSIFWVRPLGGEYTVALSVCFWLGAS